MARSTPTRSTPARALFAVVWFALALWTLYLVTRTDDALGAALVAWTGGMMTLPIAVRLRRIVWR